MAEYASLTAALAILASSLGGALGAVGQLPATNLKATALVAAAARSQNVSGSAARTAYDNAPYKKPTLRYLYSIAWVAAAKDEAKCRAQLWLGPDPTNAAAAGIRHTPKLLARLKAAHLTVAQAAAALARGMKDGCG